ncbi:MAG: hypothetical protein E7507_00105 [Ruminococcus sp.]|nr:hypothetical protein [Ruminococcus sp.]
MEKTELNTEEVELDVSKEADEVVDTLEVSKDKNKKREKYAPVQAMPDVPLPKELQPRKLLPEEILKIIIGVILVLLFIALFIGIVWYFMIQLDSTLFDEVLGTAENCIGTYLTN